MKEVTVPGRAGTLTLKEGANVHEGYLKECRVTVRSDADYASLLDWLSGDGWVVFSNEPDRAYWAHLGAEVKFTREGNTLKSATIPFYVHPHKAQYPPESDITLSTSGSVYNPGTVAAKPKIALTFTGGCTIVLGGSTLTLTHADSETQETVIVDCDAELITQDGELWEGVSNNDFPAIPTGTQTVTLTDCTAVITPRWRWY